MPLFAEFGVSVLSPFLVLRAGLCMRRLLELVTKRPYLASDFGVIVYNNLYLAAVSRSRLRSKEISYRDIRKIGRLYALGNFDIGM